MDTNTVFLLGGYGGAGRSIASLLLRETDLDLIIAGRHKDAAERLSRDLNLEFAGRTKGAYADASDPASLASAFKDVDMVIAASTTAQHVEVVALAAIEAGIDYLDIHHPQRIVPILMRLAPEIQDAGLCFITQAGFHPGLPSVLTRYASKYFTRYKKALVGMAMNTQFEKGAALEEFIESLGEYSTEVFKGGRWRSSGLLDVARIDFGSSLGIRTCYPMMMEEMRAMPEILGLEEAEIYVAGLNWFADFVVTPAAMALGRIRRGMGTKLLSSLMVWSLQTFCRQDEKVVLVLEAEGEDELGPLKVRVLAEGDDAYYITAVPVAACILQYLDGKNVRPGLWMMGHIVDPERFLDDMRRLGIRLDVRSLNDV